LEEKADHVKQYLGKHSSEISELHAFNMFCFPVELCQLPNLKKVVFERGFIQTIPPAIRQLINLTNLQMPSNGLSSIPDELFELTALRHLDCSFNNLTSIPEGIDDLPNLTWLSIAGNGSRKFPDLRGFQQRSSGIYQREKPANLK
jgi:internalin A